MSAITNPLPRSCVALLSEIASRTGISQQKLEQTVLDVDRRHYYDRWTTRLASTADPVLQSQIERSIVDDVSNSLAESNHDPAYTAAVVSNAVQIFKTLQRRPLTLQEHYTERYHHLLQHSAGTQERSEALANVLQSQRDACYSIGQGDFSLEYAQYLDDAGTLLDKVPNCSDGRHHPFAEWEPNEASDAFFFDPLLQNGWIHDKVANRDLRPGDADSEKLLTTLVEGEDSSRYTFSKGHTFYHLLTEAAKEAPLRGYEPYKQELDTTQEAWLERKRKKMEALQREASEDEQSSDEWGAWYRTQRIDPSFFAT